MVELNILGGCGKNALLSRGLHYETRLTSRLPKVHPLDFLLLCSVSKTNLSH